MPELPEVQTVVDHLAGAGLVGRRISAAKVYWAKTIALSSAREFCRQIRGRTVLAINRRAKYIVFVLDHDQYLLIHLRMTGRLQLTSSAGRRTKHVRVILELDDGRRLMFQDTRKFGRLFLTPTPEMIMGRLGPEPLAAAFSARFLARQLGRRRRQIKPLLIDQSFLAGLGNIYVDEALWAASIHPQRRANTLNWSEIKALHRSIRRVLRQGIRNSGTSLGSGRGNFVTPDKKGGGNQWRLKVFQQTGSPCPRCGQAIQRIIVAQRGSHVCGQCQQV